MPPHMGEPKILVAAIGLLAISAAPVDEASAQEAPRLVPPPSLVIPPAPPVEEPEVRVKSYPRVRNGNSAFPNAADYPAEAWMNDWEGFVRYKLSIDAQGMPTACEIMDSSGHEILDQTTCDIVVERAQFAPAVDENDNAIAHFYEDSFDWRKRGPEFPGTAMIKVQFTVGKDGRTRDCKVLERSGEFSERMSRNFEREPCPGANTDRIRPPYRDANGMPIDKQVVLFLGTEISDPSE